MVAAVAGCRKHLVGTGSAISSLIYTNELRKCSSLHPVGASFLVLSAVSVWTGICWSTALITESLLMNGCS